MMVKFGILAGAFALAASPVFAQVVAPNPNAFAQTLRETRVGIMTGGPGGTYIRLGADLQGLVEGAEGSNLRVLPMLGRGSVGNLQDLLYLENTDFSLVQADVLLSIQQNNPQEFDFLKNRIAYVARLHPEIIHIVAREGLSRPEDLRGKTIAVGGSGGGSAITAPIVLKDLLGVDFVSSELGPAAALNDLLSETPSLDAFLYVAGRGSSIFTDFSPEMAEKARERRIGFVALEGAPPEATPYQAVSVGHDDYPVLIGEESGGVSAWAVPAVLAVYNWDAGQNAKTRQRYDRLEKFITAFFDNRHNLNDGPGGYNDNWCEVDIGAAIGGWTRLPAAQQWLDRNPRARTRVCAARPGDPSLVLAAECRPFHEHLARADLRLEDLADPYAQFERWLLTNPKGCSGTATAAR